MLKRFILAALMAMAPLAAFAASDLVLTTGLTFVPTGPALFKGQDLNTMLSAVNTLRDQADGTTTGAYTGTFNGTVGASAPSTGAFTTLSASGAITPTGGVAAGGGFSVSPRVIATGGEPAIASTSGTDATPVATEVYIAELFIPANTTLTGVACFNGSVASGNYKVGLADANGAVVATSASTAMSGTDAYQRVAFTATYDAKGPATYYALQFVDNTTARINTHTVGNFGASKQTGQTYATGFTTITPPTTFTTALGPMCSLY